MPGRRVPTAKMKRGLSKIGRITASTSLCMMTSASRRRKVAAARKRYWRKVTARMQGTFKSNVAFPRQRRY